MARPLFGKSSYELKELLKYHKGEMAKLGKHIKNMERDKKAAETAGRTADANQIKNRIRIASGDRSKHQRKTDEVRKEMRLRK